MAPIATSRAAVALAAAALVFAGAGFGGYAILLALSPMLGAARAAAAASAILLAGPLLYLVILKLRPAPVVVVPPRAAPAGPQGAILSALAGVARDKPLLAVLGAGLFGAADVLLKQRKPLGTEFPSGTGVKRRRSHFSQ